MAIRIPHTPPLNAKGVYEVESPFALQPDTYYSCEAIRSFEALDSAGYDLLTEIYQPVGLTQTEIDEDTSVDANLITLMSETAPKVYIPDTYITSFPALDNVPYSEVVLALSITPLPDDMDLTFVKQQIKNMASDVIGISPTVNQYAIPLDGTMSQSQAALAEAARQNAINNRKTDYAKLLELQVKYDSLQSKYTVLEQMLIDSGLVT